MSLRVVLVDDHAMFRAGVRSELAPDLEVAGEAGDVEGAVVTIRAADPDVVLLDVHLPDGTGAVPGTGAVTGGEQVLHRVAGLTRARFLALSVSDSAEDVVAVIRAGARGYVTKSVTGAELSAAVRRVAEGDAVFSPRLAGFVLDAFGAATQPPATCDEELDLLSAREQEVMRLIARGYTYKETAKALFISPKTVETHVSAVLRKLQLSNRAELTRWATQRRLL